MEHLTGLDASFLEAEDSDPHVSLAIGAVSVIEGPLPDDNALVSVLRHRMLTIPRCRQVLRTHPLGVGAPEWVEDANLDLSHHLRRVAVPHPGDDHALFRLVAYIMERRLARDYPLWECWIIEGLADNQWAILTKMHHSMADGIAAMQVLSAMTDDGGGDTFATAIRASAEPNRAGIALPRLTWNPLAWMQGAWHDSTAVANAAARAINVAAGIVGGLIRPAAASSFIGSVTTMRRYSVARVSLDDVTQVCHAYDVTINDVALAVITASLREALIRRGEQPKPNSVRTLVPVSVRSNATMGEAHNLVSAMLVYLPVDAADPVEQLASVHTRLSKAKVGGQRQAASLIATAADYIPFAVSVRAVRALTRLPQRSIVTVTTNVPGPRQPVRVMGRTVLRVMPVVPIALQVRIGIAVLSYASDLSFGITADYDTAPDVDKLAEGIESGLARLVASNKRPRRSSGGTKRKGAAKTTPRRSRSSTTTEGEGDQARHRRR
ncbi:wax ester/triacylglycerol synthase family O-acyltransferase [Mycobacterium sp.]|uniref:WS/DGAT/MGAT family O-acyltransferase n=1 Tax=Mycobacterium sp. TaxID=1785 RepID=UPI002BC917DC|nr:wax ester/triacylglycerol synthase family O-acyltransferase [Mycobacterium sp.]HME46553.1 wax ester/triacylglycerol synthase family O-acyltransferase [Mycobacterium sp.]